MKKMHLNNMVPKVFLIGDINVDVIMPIGVYPARGEDCIASAAHILPGGSVANTAQNLVSLGVQAALIGKVGTDQWAELALSRFASSGVDISHVSRDMKDSTGLTLIPVTTDGERTMFSYRGANTSLTPDDIPASFFGAEYLHVSGYCFLESPQCEAAWKAIQAADAAGLKISLDTEFSPIQKAEMDIRRLISMSSVLVIGFPEAQALSREETLDAAAGCLLKMGAKIVAIKFGAKGCCIFSNREESYSIPAFHIEAVDSTGAGDAFDAGLLYCLLRQAPIPVCGVMASALGAFSASHLGGGICPNKEDILRLLESELQRTSTISMEWLHQAIQLLH